MMIFRVRFVLYLIKLPARKVLDILPYHMAQTCMGLSLLTLPTNYRLITFIGERMNTSYNLYST